MPKVLEFKKNGLEIRAKSSTKAEIIIYDSIGEDPWSGGGISAKSFSEEMKKIDASVKEIEVRINSPGGSVFDGITIYNRLKQHPAKKTVYVDGLAASIASVIALVGDKVVMGDGSLFMIHLPFTWAVGNRNELENTINRLMDVEEQMLSIYTKRTGLERSEVRAMLEKETWLDAKDSKDFGFATEVVGEAMPIAASIFDKSHWITKRPTLMKTQEAVVKNTIKDLKEKISAKLARK